MVASVFSNKLRNCTLRLHNLDTTKNKYIKLTEWSRPVQACSVCRADVKVNLSLIDCLGRRCHALSPYAWRRRRPVRRLCTAVRRSLSWWGGRWSTQRWGRSGRAPPLLQTPAAGPVPCPCPSPRSTVRSMTPTWTTPQPARNTQKQIW